MPSLKEIVAEAKKKGFSKEDLFKELLQRGYSRKEIEEAFGNKNLKTKNKQTELGSFEKIKYLFSNPQGFFENVKDATIGKSLSLYCIAFVIGVVLLIGVSMAFSGLSLSRGYFGVSYFGLFGIGYAIIMFVLSLIWLFIYAGIAHLLAKGVGGNGSFTDSYNAVTYSLIPPLFLMFIPIIGWLGIIYSIVLMCFGFAEYHNISKGKAVVPVLVPLVIGVIVGGVLLYIAVSMLFGGVF